MRIQPDCIPCVFQMAVSGMHEIGLPEESMRKVCTRIARIPALCGHAWDVTSPDVIEAVLDILSGTLGDQDPFRDLKQRQNRAMLDVKPRLQGKVSQAGDPLELALRLAVLGNAVDLMLADRPETLDAELETRLLRPEAIRAFRRRLDRSRSIVYLADNAGEIVLDGLLMERLRQEGKEVVLVVRSRPAMNDVTLGEIGSAGLEEDLPVMENGISGPFPGTRLARCSPEVRRRIEACDLIISKGGGNFDSFGEEPRSILDKTAFLLLSKCRPYCERFGAARLDPVLLAPGASQRS